VIAKAMLCYIICSHSFTLHDATDTLTQYACHFDGSFLHQSVAL